MASYISFSLTRDSDTVSWESNHEAVYDESIESANIGNCSKIEISKEFRDGAEHEFNCRIVAGAQFGFESFEMKSKTIENAKIEALRRFASNVSALTGFQLDVKEVRK